MLFPYERYESLAEPMRVFYPTGEEAQARWVSQTIDNAGKLLISLLNQPMPGMEILLVSSADWGAAPPEDFCSAGDDGLNKPLHTGLTLPIHPTLLFPQNLIRSLANRRRKNLPFCCIMN